MTVWSKQQIRNVSLLYNQVVIDRHSIRHEDEILGIKQKAARVFVGEAFTFAVEVDVRDLAFKMEDYDDFRVKMLCYWRPETTEIEFLGGPADGDVLAVNSNFNDIQKISFNVPVKKNADPIGLIDPGNYVPSEIATYRMSGWHEEKRHWMFSLS